jgi:hypothetical protein
MQRQHENVRSPTGGTHASFKMVGKVGWWISRAMYCTVQPWVFDILSYSLTLSTSQKIILKSVLTWMCESNNHRSLTIWNKYGSRFDRISQYQSFFTNFRKSLEIPQILAVKELRIFSEGQEKYLRELSITPVGYFTGAIKNHSCPTGTILHGENEVFQRNRNDFPKVSFTLDVI